MVKAGRLTLQFATVAFHFACLSHVTAFSASSSSRTRTIVGDTNNSDRVTSKSSFWESPSKVASLPDPPSDKILQSILERPHRGGFEPIWDIPTYSPTITYGKIPSDLIGTLATNGPGRIRIKGRQFGHWFDGDGYVTSLVLNGETNEVSFTGKYVRTERYNLQCNADDDDATRTRIDEPPLAFGGFWTQKGTGKWYENLICIPKNPANTATLWLPPRGNGSSRLYALCEGGNPIMLHPYTLETIGDETPFEKSRDINTDKADADADADAGAFFSAHFSKCHSTGKLYNHGTIINPFGPNSLKLMQMDEDGTVLQERVVNEHDLAYDAQLHDSAISSDYMAYITCPWIASDNAMVQMLIGREALGNMYQWDEEKGSYIYIHNLEDLSLKYKIKLPNLMSMYHLVDVYNEPEAGDTDEGGEVIYIRVAEHETNDRAKLEEQFGNPYQNAKASERQIRAKLREYKVICKVGEEPIVTVSDIGGSTGTNPPSPAPALCEFPALNAAWNPNTRNRYCWTNAASSDDVPWLDGIQKVDMLTGECSDVKTFGEGCYGCGPAFVPKDKDNGNAMSEDDGYIISNVYCSKDHRTDVVVLDAKTLDLLCRIGLEHHVPYQFHGDFMPHFLGM